MTRACSAAVACIALALPGRGRAAEATGSGVYDDITSGAALDLHALADGYFAYNFNRPANGRNQLRQFDFTADRPALELARITLAHRPGTIGFRFDVAAGDTIDAFYRSDPASSSHPDLARVLSHLEQAFATVVVAAGGGILVDAGKFASPAGLEDNENLGNWNFSRSLGFTFGEPSLHTGLRVSYPAQASLTGAVFLVNGWNSDIVGGNDLRTFAGALEWKPNSDFDGALVYIGGPERAPQQLASSELSFRNLVNGFFTWSPTAKLSVALSADYGNDRARGGVSFWGAAGYVRVAVRSWLHLAGRGEWFADPQGFMTGTPQSVGEVTATAELRATHWGVTWLARPEYRHDQSTAHAFETSDGSTRTVQDTLTLELLASF